MEEDMMKKISLLLGEETGIDSNRIYNHIKKSLENDAKNRKGDTKEEKENEDVSKLKEELKDIFKRKNDDEQINLIEDASEKDRATIKSLKKLRKIDAKIAKREKEELENAIELPIIEDKLEKKVLKDTSKISEEERKKEIQKLSIPEAKVEKPKKITGKLHVVADLKENEYCIIDDAGNKLLTRTINGLENGTYKEGMSQRLVDIRRNKLIKNHKYVDRENVKNVDTITYKLLEDLDKIHSTDYATKYLKLMVIQPNRRESESDEKYKNKLLASKRKALRKLNVDFTYNTKGILFLKGVKLKDKIKYLKTVSKQQKYAGAQVYSNFIGLFKNKNKMLNAATEENKVENKKKTLKLSKKKFPKMTFKSFHMPKLNINIDKAKAKKYFGRTVLAGVAALSMFGAMYNSKTFDNTNTKNNTNIEYSMDNENSHKDLNNKFAESLRVNIEKKQVENNQEQDLKQENQEVEQVVENTENVEQNSVISQIKNLVNNSWEISDGKFYSSPDGTGNFGNFGDHKEKVNVDMVNLLDEAGNKICTVSPEELNNLPEDIAAQVKGFQYHVSNENTDLGWNTDKQLDELNKSNSIHSVEEENER